MNEVRESTRYVVENAQMVQINENAIMSFAQKMSLSDFERTEYADGDDELTTEQLIALTFVFQAACYSFWGNPKWTVVHDDGKKIDGSRAMLSCFRRAVTLGTPLLDAGYLKSMTIHELANILKGNIEIPLLQDRHAMLRQLGEVITGSYDGSFTSFVDAANWDAPSLTHRLVSELPEIFDDQAEYLGRHIFFYKRAQLVPAKLHDYWRVGKIAQKISVIEQLTAFADYKIPQLLRQLGILVYTPELEQMIDGQVELEPSSPAEIEIRASTVWAIEKLRTQLEERFGRLSAAQVDTAVFLLSRDDNNVTKPYHHTRTVWY